VINLSQCLDMQLSSDYTLST